MRGPHRADGHARKRHELREDERRQRRAVDRRSVGDKFRTFRVSESDLPPHRMAHQRGDAITHARGMAMGAGLRVVDVVHATWQDSGDWLVELAVESAA